MDITDITEAIMDELEDRSLLNGIDDDIREEIEEAIGTIIERMGCR